MRSISFRSALLLALALPVGCAGVAAESSDDSSEDALTNAKVKLPAKDQCRDVLAPLALGLAEGALGLDGTKSITVSLTSETDERDYVVVIAGEGTSVTYGVTLDNDSASSCMLVSVEVSEKAKPAKDARTKMTASERKASVPVPVTPADDECASSVKLLAQAAAVSAVGGGNAEKVDAALESASDTRDYRISVDGKAFSANGQEFQNDFTFDLTASNDSASKCFVERLAPRH